MMSRFTLSARASRRRCAAVECRCVCILSVHLQLATRQGKINQAYSGTLSSSPRRRITAMLRPQGLARKLQTVIALGGESSLMRRGGVPFLPRHGAHGSSTFIPPSNLRLGGSAWRRMSFLPEKSPGRRDLPPDLGEAEGE